MEQEHLQESMQSKRESRLGSTAGSEEGLEARGRLFNKEMWVSKREVEMAGIS
jgi:hypothetical protein